MPKWPGDKLLKHGPDLPMAERVRRYQENIKTIRAAGCTVPTMAYTDTLDPVVIEMWLTDNDYSVVRIADVMRRLASEDD